MSNQSNQNAKDQPASPEEEALWSSGRYQPPKIEDDEVPHAQLQIDRARNLDLQLEEFPEGPYGSVRNDEKLGRVTPWKAGQAAMSPHVDSNPMSSNRKVPMNQPHSDDPIGTIEGQN